MTIETYSEKYLFDVLRLVQNFHKEAIKDYDIANPDAIIQTINSAQHENAFLLIINGVCQGILYGAILRSPTSGEDIFQEVIWYVNEKFRLYGIKMLKAVEKILKSRGVKVMIMAVLENSKAEKIKDFYERLGFKAMETHYVRAI